MYESVEQFTDKAYIVALLSCCISTLGDIDLFGSIANIKTVTKYPKGNQNLILKTVYILGLPKFLNKDIS